MERVLSGENVVVAVKDQVSSILGDEAVILHLGQGSYYGLNEVGTLIWSLLQKPVTIDDIIAEVATQFEVSKKQSQEDIFGLMDKLCRAKLIEITERA